MTLVVWGDLVIFKISTYAIDAKLLILREKINRKKKKRNKSMCNKKKNDAYYNVYVTVLLFQLSLYVSLQKKYVYALDYFRLCGLGKPYLKLLDFEFRSLYKYGLNAKAC